MEFKRKQGSGICFTPTICMIGQEAQEMLPCVMDARL